MDVLIPNAIRALPFILFALSFSDMIHITNWEICGSRMTLRSLRNRFVWNRDPLLIWKQEPWYNEDATINYGMIDW